MPNTVPAADPGLPSRFCDDELARLRDELDAVHSARLANEAEQTPEEADEPLHARQWELREQIDRQPAVGFLGLFAKARAAAIALERDGEPEDAGPGSFSGLALSIMRDLRAIEARMATCPIAFLAGEMEKIIPASNRLDKGKPEHWKIAYDHLTDCLSDIEKKACDHRARSARGVMLQIFIIDTEIETVLANSKDDDSDAQRRIERALYSVASAIEELSGERLPACRGYYQSDYLDPFGLMERALAGEDTPPAETSEMQEGAS